MCCEGLVEAEASQLVAMGEDLGGRALERDAAAVHHDHAVRWERLFHEVGDVHDGGACGVQAVHHVEDRPAAAHVEQGAGLVEDNRGGFHRERTGDGHALLLAAGELGGVGRGIVVEGHAV